MAQNWIQKAAYFLESPMHETSPAAVWGHKWYMSLKSCVFIALWHLFDGAAFSPELCSGNVRLAVLSDCYKNPSMDALNIFHSFYKSNMPNSFPITGIPKVDGHPHPERQDVDAWYLKRDDECIAYQLSLFVRALWKLMSKDPTDELSYFGIAGIHGEPLRSWDGVEEGSNIFCAHNQSIFPTWHRPYLLLIEQVIHSTMKDILCEYDTHESFPEWEQAADTWRFPYWDWTNPKLPEIVACGDHITIRKLPSKSKNENETIRNPFWQFNTPGGKSFAELGTEEASSSSKTIATSKWGIIRDQEPPPWIYGVQNWEAANHALGNPEWYGESDYVGSIATAVERLFAPDNHQSWESFATTAYNSGDSSDTGFMNLEYIHNNIHNWTGGPDDIVGTGHMSDLGYAAFDPVFWLHHCNVDRLTSIWLELYPKKFFDKPQANDPSPKDPLAPFHRDTNRTAWNSNDAQYTKPWNYTYDNLHRESGQNDDDYLSIIRKTIKELYGQTQKDFKRFQHIVGIQNDYILNIIYDRYGLNGKSYTIHFFLGPVNGEPSVYSHHPNRIGILYTFSSQLEVSQDAGGDAKPKCENCADQKAAGVLSRGQIVLTRALLKVASNPSIPNFSSLEPTHVSTYLTQNLNWRAVDNIGNEIDIERQLPHTKIFALGGVAHHYEGSDELSHYRDYSILSEPCQGKPGGVGTHP